MSLWENSVLHLKCGMIKELKQLSSEIRNTNGVMAFFLGGGGVKLYTL